MYLLWPNILRGQTKEFVKVGVRFLASFELVTKAPQEKMVRWTYKTIRTVIGIPRDEVDIIFQGNTIFVSLNGSTSCDEQADDLTDEYR